MCEELLRMITAHSVSDLSLVVAAKAWWPARWPSQRTAGLGSGHEQSHVDRVWYPAGYIGVSFLSAPVAFQAVFLPIVTACIFVLPLAAQKGLRSTEARQVITPLNDDGYRQWIARERAGTILEHMMVYKIKVFLIAPWHNSTFSALFFSILWSKPCSSIVISGRTDA